MNTDEKPIMIALPVDHSDGLQSLISDHFGKAPGFIVADASGSTALYLDAAKHRGASECAPIEALTRAGARIVAAKSMGKGALRRCHEAGMRIFQAEGRTVADYLARIASDSVTDFPDDSICHHAHEGAHAGHGKKASEC
jgi:predicted Fe-Mo cluster-binding NifX family protein